MREVLERVAQLQPQWSHKNTPEMQERGQLIRHTGPDWLRGFSAELADAIGIPLEDLIIEGRDGTGPKTEVPWFRYGSRVRSPSATIGWYCVYLFSTDGSTIYLSLGRGSTEWNGIEFKPRDHDELRTQAAWARSAAGGTPADMADTIDLQSRRSNLGPSYEAGTVFALEYGADSIPGSAQLRADAIRVGRLLGTLYEAEGDPGAPGLPPEVREAVDTAATTAGKAATLSSSAGFRPNAEQRSGVSCTARCTLLCV